MKYEDVLKLITPDNVRAWCSLSSSYKNLLVSTAALLKTAKGESNHHAKKTFIALLFEAWMEWNKLHQKSNHIDYPINIESNQIIILEFSNGKYWQCYRYPYYTFESGHPLLPPVQALICALVKARELEVGK